MSIPLPDWKERRVLLTGAGGFLGSYLKERVERTMPAALLTPSSKELDLRDSSAIGAYLSKTAPDLVIHAAAVVGGIGANRRSPGRFFYENAIMGIELIDASRRANVRKFVCLGTVCSYPKFAPVPFRESDLWNGYPEETNAPYGIAKKALLVQLASYREEYGFDGISLLPANLYGPRDHFDLQTSHVIPAMIRKFVEAAERGDREVVLWGDGSPSREFLYVEDAADGIVAAADRYGGAEPVNLGTGREITIGDLAQIIREKTGFQGSILWDTSQPNGQLRRSLDTTRAAELFGFRAVTSLEKGLARTIEWYRGQKRANREDGARSAS